MSTNQTGRLRDVAAGNPNAVTKQEPPKDFEGMLVAWKGEMGRALPRHMDPDRMARIALTEFRKNPMLGDCKPKSVFGAVIVASQLGLEPGVLGQAFLVPYKRSKKVDGKWHEWYECQLIPGWQGYVDLVSRAGRASVWTGAVFKGDEFDYAQGDRPFITHRRGDADEIEENLTHVYAVGRIKGAEWPIIEVWSVSKVKRHLTKFNKQGDKHYALKGNFEMYGRKVALLQVLKYMPKSPELAAVQELDVNAGHQRIDSAINDKGVLETTWAIEPDADDEPGAETSGGGAPPQGEDAHKVTPKPGIE